MRVNCIYPGLIETEMGAKVIEEQVRSGLFDSRAAAEEAFCRRPAVGRLGRVQDVVQAALFLCSDAASYVTGIGLPVDAGVSIS